ncbi:hypothetical protein [Natronorubrum tibetense]|uniref:DUF8106 domain-containing protein n=1 Tax=Natronorubrum tibetense GA33 TaxID=1114856 RepID=L9VQA1_9EURY|nr:hypothetical protein [Natronorubrum tibetense]ELY39231.1 hypothetical protein C496_15277 [Natronorubrum tibetense GA33]
MTRPATNHDERTPVPRKSTLFCWECDHASPIDGDWVRWTRERHEEYVCPVCETTIAKRPRPDDTTRDRRPPRPAASWHRAVRTTMRVWRASLDISVSSVAAMPPYSIGRVR